MKKTLSIVLTLLILTISANCTFAISGTQQWKDELEKWKTSPGLSQAQYDEAVRFLNNNEVEIADQETLDATLEIRDTFISYFTESGVSTIYELGQKDSQKYRSLGSILLTALYFGGFEADMTMDYKLTIFGHDNVEYNFDLTQPISSFADNSSNSSSSNSSQGDQKQDDKKDESSIQTNSSSEVTSNSNPTNNVLIISLVAAFVILSIIAIVVVIILKKKKSINNTIDKQ